MKKGKGISACCRAHDTSIEAGPKRDEIAPVRVLPELAASTDDILVCHPVLPNAQRNFKILGLVERL
ncbi:MAG: hypothetical protein AAFY56_03805, partial [Pseudomonadota bacterium]